MNQMIMQAKVYTVRDAQVREKKVIAKEQYEEERRLDGMMEQVGAHAFAVLAVCALTCGVATNIRY